MSALLEGEGLVKAYGRGRRAFAALDGVGFRLEAGRTLGVVGASGSGKTTLGELAGGLQRPTSGRVVFRGEDVASLDAAGRRAFRRAVQFVFQDPAASMDPGYTVARVVAEPLDMFERGMGAREKRERVLGMLARVGLGPETADRRPQALSGGQCQRVAIARALVARPSVVVCDECTSALDVSVQAQILNLLRDLQGELGIAYLFISHDIGVVSYMADDVLVMRRGRAVESGPAADVFARPRDPYTKALLHSAEPSPGEEEAAGEAEERGEGGSR